MNSDVIAPAATRPEQQATSPVRDYPAEPIRSQWVVDLASHRVVKRAARSPAPRTGSPAYREFPPGEAWPANPRRSSPARGGGTRESRSRRGPLRREAR